jgi:hypothetical protein
MLPGASTRFEAVVFGDGGDAARVIEASGGRVVATLSWDGSEEIGVAGERPVLVVDAIGAHPDALAAVLPQVAAVADARVLSVVVALDDSQVDLVAAELLGERIHLLHRPTLAEWVAELALAARESDPDVSGVRETDSERLSRLNDELSRLVDLLARLTRAEPRPGPADRTTGFGAAPPDAGATAIDPAEVRRVIRARRLRDKAFEAGMFEDPAWDILLDLFAASLERSEVSVSSLCIAAAVAPTTALRWVGRMTSAGLLVRQHDPFDRRRALMSLSPRSMAAMRSYVAMLRAQGLPFV